MRILAIFATVLYFLNTDVQALKCYICSTGGGQIDQRCINNPAEVEGNNILNCNKNYCTTTRVEYLDPKGEVESMVRDCLDKPGILNEIIEDATKRYYYTSCQTDLCNGGSGKDISQGGLVGDIGDAIVLLVPGKGVSEAATLSCFTFLILSATMFMYYFI